MKDYKLSEVRAICQSYSNCMSCPLWNGDECPLRDIEAEEWNFEFDEEPAIVHTMDNVNHPSHYTSGCGFECIDMMKMILSDDEFEGFCIGNAIKYIWRHKDKGGTEDLLKAKWYLETLSKDNRRGMVKDIYTLLWCKVNDLLEETE